MKFASLGHLDYDYRLQQMPKDWFHEKFFLSPEINYKGTKGYFIALKYSAEQMMSLPREKIQQSILDAAVFAQDELGVELVQLGALTTSVTSGGLWLVEQKEYAGFVNHGDSYTAAVACQTITKALAIFNKKPSGQVLAIVGAYGVIGEAVSKLLVSQFSHSLLIGRNKEKLSELGASLKGSIEVTTDLEKTRDADVIMTATSHPTALLHSEHFKDHAIVVDVSQPPNVLPDVCEKRPDVCRIDGGFVDFPKGYLMPIPGIPPGKLFACIVEVIMQAMINERKNHVGSIDLRHLHKTERWAQKYGFLLKELTNFGQPINQKHMR